MRKPILAATAIACLTLSAGMCEQEQPVERICKGKAEAACTQDPRCTWSQGDDAEGQFKCRERE